VQPAEVVLIGVDILFDKGAYHEATPNLYTGIYIMMSLSHLGKAFSRSSCHQRLSLSDSATGRGRPLRQEQQQQQAEVAHFDAIASATASHDRTLQPLSP